MMWYVLRQRLLQRFHKMDSEMFWCCELVVWTMLICDAVSLFWSLMAVITVILHYKGGNGIVSQKSRSHHEINKWWEMYFGLICKERSLKACFISWLRRIVLRSSLLTLSGFAAASVGLDSWWIECVCGLITARAEGISDPERQWEKPWRIAVSLTAVLLLGPSDRPVFLSAALFFWVTAIGRLSCVELLWVRFFQKHLV